MYAEIAIPKTGFKLFTYLIPQQLERSIVAGIPVIVPLKRQYAAGVVMRKTSSAEIPDIHIRKISGLIDPVLTLTKAQLDVFEWLADYYVCPLGDVLKAAFPPGLLGQARMRIVAGDIEPEDSRHRFVYDKVREAPGGYPFNRRKQIINGVANSLIKKMIVSGILYLKPDLKIQKAKEQVFVRLSKDIAPDIIRTRLTPRQRELADYLISHPEGLSASQLRDIGFSRSLIDRVIENDVAELDKRSDDSIVQPRKGDKILYILTSQQQGAFMKINEAITKGKNKAFLLYGVTGSGKTMVYIEAARSALARSKSVLILLPEISLTPQAIERFSSSLDEPIALWHSRITGGQRHDIYRKVKLGEIRIVLGVRSAVFSPLRNLGLIIVDEEQDDSYKQSEPPPRYNARDVALFRGRTEKAVVMLGSATPSMESFYNAQNGKYELLHLSERYGGVRLPKSYAIDLRNTEINHKIWPLSDAFIEKICAYVAEGKQVIILLNRRGYAGLLLCKSCGWVALCPECKVALTYHKSDLSLRCHFCDHTEKAPADCPECGSNAFDYRGIGTQKLEEMLVDILGKRGIIRMDSDSTSRKGALEHIISTFEVGERPVLLGTRMVAKGHHFPQVGMVGVVLADAGLHLPDFRASEKVFQLLVQAAGRAGRSGDSTEQGEFVVQSYDPSSGILDYATSQNYEIFYVRELAYRRELGYPPFGKIIRMVLSGDDQSLTRWAARQAARTMRSELNSGKVLGPASTGIFRLHNKYHYQVMLKGRFTADFKKRLRNHLAEGDFGQKKGVLVKIDVDPREML